MKHVFTILLLLITGFSVAGNPIDSIRKAKLEELTRIGEFWKTQPVSHDTVFCAGFCEVAVARPVYLHDGNFPSGSEFDFMEAKPGDVLGPYVDRNSVGVYRFIGRELVSDSVRISQILVAHAACKDSKPGVKRSREKARSRADSICYELRTGKIFMNEIAWAESDDNLPWNGPNENSPWMTRSCKMPIEVIDACFGAKTGDFLVVESTRGFHVVHIDTLTHVWEAYAAWRIIRRIDSCSTYDGVPLKTDAFFPGGNIAMNQYFIDNQGKYDSLAVHNEGLKPVLVLFEVLPDGRTANVGVFRQSWITPGIVIDITRMIKAMPVWTPARTCDGPVLSGHAVIIYL